MTKDILYDMVGNKDPLRYLTLGPMQDLLLDVLHHVRRKVCIRSIRNANVKADVSHLFDLKSRAHFKVSKKV